MYRAVAPSLLLLLLSTPASAWSEGPEVEVPRPWEHASSDLTPHPGIRFGEFENGLRWATMTNAEPDQRVYVRMHVNAGSLAEQESERGMAHFLEHMAFNGSANFPPGTLVEWLQERGLDFGAHTNAYTSFSETVYMLDLPSSDARTLEESLWVMRDFAGELLLESDEIEAEKGVIDGEERERDSAAARVSLDLLKRQLAGTRVAERLPIGTKEARDAFTAESVRAFYERWYRPENITVIVVGDLGELDPVPVIELTFGDFEGPDEQPKPEPPLGSMTNEEAVITISDPELVVAQISVGRIRPYEDEPYDRRHVLDGLPLDTAHQMLNLRLRRLVREGKAPFLGAFTFEEDLVGVARRETLAVSCRPDVWSESLAAAEQELRRALQHGFSPTELEELRADALLGLTESVESEATRSSRSWADELVRAAESRYVPTSAATDLDLFAPAYRALTVEACHDALVKAWESGEFSLQALGPVDLSLSAEQRLLSAWEESASVAVDAPEASAVAEFQYASSPARLGEITSRTTIADLGVESVVFENGVRVFLKPTDFKARQVLLLALFGEGNLSIEKERLALAMAAGSAFNGAGLGRHDEDELRRLLAGRQVSVAFDTDTDHFSLGGVTTSEDLLLQMEVVCAYLTDPGWRPDALALFHRRIPQLFESLEKRPDGPLARDFIPELYDGDPRFGMPSLPALQAITMDEIRDWLEPHLRSAPMTVCMVGDFRLEDAIEKARQTFGVLPPRRALEPYAARREAPEMKAGLRSKLQVDSTTPKSLVYVTFPTTDGIDAANRRALHLLARVLNDRVRLEIRERLGATYSPSASSEASQVYRGVGRISISALSDPTGADAVVDACLAVADQLVERGVTTDELRRLKEPLLASLRDSQRSNSWWVQQLSRLHDQAGALDESRRLVQDYEQLDADQMTALARRFLDRSRASVLVVHPKDA